MFRWRMHREPAAEAAFAVLADRGRGRGGGGLDGARAHPPGLRAARPGRRRRSSSASFSASFSIVRPRWPQLWIAWPRASGSARWPSSWRSPAMRSPYLTEAQAWPRTRSSIFLRSWGRTERSSVPRSGRRASAIRSQPPRRPTRPHFSSAKTCPTAPRRLGLFAVRAVRRTEPDRPAVRPLVGGERLDQSFLADLPVAPGMQVGLYSDGGPDRERQPRREQAAAPVLPAASIPSVLWARRARLPARPAISR